MKTESIVNHFNVTHTWKAEEIKQIAVNINRQIKASDHMACGTSEFICGEADNMAYLRFKVNRPLRKRGLFKLFVFYDYGKDEYIVQLVKCNTRPTCEDDMMTIIDQKTGVYADNLSETIYRMCNN